MRCSYTFRSLLICICTFAWGRIVKAEAEEARLASELELSKAEEDRKALELEVRQQQEALEQQLEIVRLKLAAESESKRAETEQALKIQVRQKCRSERFTLVYRSHTPNHALPWLYP